MTANAFIGKPEKPTNAELAAALGPVKVVWDQLLADLAQDFGVNGHEWKCHSPKWGWSLRVKRKERTIVWLSPAEGAFIVLFILGDKAMKAARESKLPQRIIKVLDAAPKYPEGTGVRLEVKTSRQIGLLKKLAAIKLAN
ncbi:MAG: DUF3788 domain-containing protein [Verrucomicrobia bacterium]|nr:DUF3788 domain-containing protein [Verrucomicrobiota bacterium]